MCHGNWELPPDNDESDKIILANYHNWLFYTMPSWKILDEMKAKREVWCENEQDKYTMDPCSQVYLNIKKKSFGQKWFLNKNK